MMERSFVMLPGVGRETERRIWTQGVRSWDDFMSAPDIEGISRRRLDTLKSQAHEISESVANGDSECLATLLPPSEHWRLLEGWNEGYVCLDIEVSSQNGKFFPVVLSVLRGDECTTLVRGDGFYWSAFDEIVSDADFLVTFNGSSFDLPLLERCGYSVRGPVHLDLRRFCRKIGLNGGLKSIEGQLGIHRDRELEFSTSEQVSYLWRLWESKGSKNALDRLIAYNQRDACSLSIIAKEIYRRYSDICSCTQL